MERPSKRLCVMFNGKCDRCGHVPCHADHIPSPSPESLEGIMDIPNPIEPNVWEELLEEDARQERMSRDYCLSLDDANSWPLFLINKSVERLRDLSTTPDEHIRSTLTKSVLIQMPARDVQDHVLRIFISTTFCSVTTDLFGQLQNILIGYDWMCWL